MIKIYSTDNCIFCKIAKEYLESKEIPHTVVDVGTDLFARNEMKELSGQMGVPVLSMGEKFMIGWDEEKFNKFINEETN